MPGFNRLSDEEDPEKTVFNPLFTTQMDSGGGDEYKKLLMSQLSAPPEPEPEQGMDQYQLAAALGSAANAAGSVGGRKADSSGLQNWADLMTKMQAQKQDKLALNNSKRQALLAQFALLKDKAADTAVQRDKDAETRLASGKEKFEQDKELKDIEFKNAQALAAAKVGQEKLKPPTADEKTSALFATRAKDASDLAENIEGQGYNPASYGASFRSTSLPFVGQVAATGEDRSYNQAKRSFISAVLRKESGAAISDKEYANEEKKYFPEPGDGPEQLAQKAAERSRAVQTLITASGGAYSPTSQRPFDYKKPVDRSQPEGLMAAETPANAPKIGDVIKGYKFKGGNPADKTSWEKVE